ncbi:MAG TPA: WYL domain-containing protein [Burkholderiaceae bacterium]|nr:WYL domain-containing protein [Burkholderiaceae bacterium]
MPRQRADPRHELLLHVPRAQLERLSYIDFRLFFLGELRRNDLMERFGTGPAGATRDIATYRQIAPQNLDLNASTKVYEPAPGFEPVFDHDPQRTLTALSKGFGEGIDKEEPLLRCETPFPLSEPDMTVLAPITRAIHRGKVVRLTYHSITSGKEQREIVPFGLVSNGVRWHARAYDRKSRDFRDFVLTRMEAPQVLEESLILREESPEHDVQWSRIVELELVVHPDHPRPDVVRRDYSLTDGVLKVKARATNLGYLLQLWRVDCSPTHNLRALEFPLWLRDPFALHGVENALLAPGYVSPAQIFGSLAKGSEQGQG